jgi:arsenite/tail-anchored protein-transporting ATPase
MDEWGTTIQPPVGGGGGTQQVSVLIASSSHLGGEWHRQILTDSRFRVVGMAMSFEDLQFKMQSGPEAAIIEGPIFRKPQQLAEFLTSVSKTAIYLVVPPSLDDKSISGLQNIGCVKGIFKGDISISQVAPKMIQDVEVNRMSSPEAAAIQFTSGGKPTGSGGGTLIITLWSAAGGTGKSTIAAALAQEAAQRDLRTLLIGLRVPDTIPALFNIKRTPNISNWFSAPGPEGFKRSIQSVGNFDCIVGHHDKAREEQLYAKPEEAHSISKLVSEALAARYGVILLDASYAGMNAITPANTLILVGRPTLDDAMSLAEAYRIVAQKLTGQHSIGFGNMMTVLNMQQSGLISANDFHANATKVAQDNGLTSFPHIAAEIPYDPRVMIAPMAGRFPLDSSDDFARPVHTIGDMLFGAQVGSNNGHKKGGTVKSFLGVKLRMGGK